MEKKDDGDPIYNLRQFKENILNFKFFETQNKNSKIQLWKKRLAKFDQMMLKLIPEKLSLALKELNIFMKSKI